MRQVIEMTYVVALEFKASAVTGTGPQRVLNILKGIPKYQIPAALQIVALPCVSKLLKAFQHQKETEVHRAHVEGCDFRFKRDSGLDAFLNSHIGRATAGQIYYRVGRLFDLRKKGRESCGTVVWFASLRITRMQMHNRSASFGCAD
jgi:hypothetical protein